MNKTHYPDQYFMILIRMWNDDITRAPVPFGEHSWFLSHYQRRKPIRKLRQY
jgi:hypothetical protein